MEVGCFAALKVCNGLAHIVRLHNGFVSSQQGVALLGQAGQLAAGIPLREQFGVGDVGSAVRPALLGGSPLTGTAGKQQPFARGKLAPLSI